MKREPCPHCKYNDWREQPIFTQVNPNGEFVEGYGHIPVMRQTGSRFYCISCAWLEGGNPTVITLDGSKVSET